IKSVRAQMTYDFEKKEIGINAEHDKLTALEEAHKKEQRIILILVAMAAISLAIVAIFIFRSLRITTKQKRLIELQRNDMSKQKEIIEVKQKSVLDSIHYAKRIQTTLMTSERYINKNLNRLLG